jgi:mannose-6-phosphate isomerase-like protein (cupin superfamily)
MTRSIARLGVAACLGIAACVTAAVAAEPPPAAPGPGAPAAYLSSQQLSQAMKASIAKGSVPALAQIASTDQYFINEVHRTVVTGAAVHPGWTEVHIILAGSGTFVTGGQIKTSGNMKIVEGGVSQRVAKGDVIVVPADTPHWYKQIDGSLDAIEVRFVRPDAAPPAR